MRRNPVERKTVGGRETVDEIPDEKKMLEKKIGSDRERVSEEGDRGEGAKREIRHTVLKGQVKGNRLIVKAGAVPAG